MGVHGLWQLLQAAGRPVSLETLDGKILAVDVSLWLHQTMKGMRDKEGNPLPNAHLHGLFTRICKLLFYRIKPVFVFDGGAPVLKRQTLAARRERKETAERESGKTNKKLLENLIKGHAVKAALGQDTSATTVAAGTSSSNRKPDIFELAPLPDVDRGSTDAMNYEDEFEEERMAFQQIVEEKFQSIDNVDTESTVFQSLPLEIQHEILTEMKEVRKRYFTVTEDLPEDSDDFSSFQLSKLMKRSKLTGQIDEVRKTMNAKSSGEITESLGLELCSENVISSRVVSEDSSHYILIKGLSKKQQIQEAQDCEQILAEVEKMEPKKKSVKMCFEESSNGEISSELDELLLNSEEELLREKYKLKLNQETFESTDNVKDNADCEYSDDVVITSHTFTDTGEQKYSDIELVDKTKQNVQQTEGNSSASDDEGFIEVTLDPTTAGEDDLFPAAMFDSAIKKDFIEELTKLKEKKTKANMASSKSSVEHTYSKTAGDLIKKSVNTQDEHRVIGIHEMDKSSNDISNPSGSSNVENFASKSFDDENKGSNSKQDITDVQSDNIPKTDSSPSEITNQNLSEVENIQNLKKIDVESEDFKSLPPEIQVELFTEMSKQQVTDKQVDDIDYETKSDDVKSTLEMFDVEEHSTDNVDLVEEDEEDEEKTEEDDRRDFSEEFSGLNREALENMQGELELESGVLRLERGKQERLATSITDQMNMEAQELLQLFGIPYVVSPMEAEAQCAFLDENKLTHGSITDDSDVWLFGGQRVYKNFFNQNRHVEFFTKAMIEATFGLPRQTLINIALLCGSDYTEGIQGVGPVTALEILAEFPTENLEGLEAFAAWWKQTQKQIIRPPESKVRNKLRCLQLIPGFPSEIVVEAYLKPTVDESLEPFSWGTPDLDLLRQFGKKRLGWTKEKVDELIKPLLKQLAESQTQAKISGFFQPESFIKPAVIKSQRVRQVLDKIKTGADSSQSIEIIQPTTKLVKARNATSNSGPKPRGKGKRKPGQKAKGKSQVKARKVNDEVALSESSTSEEETNKETESEKVVPCKKAKLVSDNTGQINRINSENVSVKPKSSKVEMNDSNELIADIAKNGFGLLFKKIRKGYSGSRPTLANKKVLKTANKSFLYESGEPHPDLKLEDVDWDDDSFSDSC